MIVQRFYPYFTVFYDVEPSDLRRIHTGHGSYAKAFEVHQKKRDGEKLRYSSLVIQEWKAALSAVPETSGYELKTFNGDEGELVKNIVKSVLKKVKSPEWNVAKHPVGLNEWAEEFEKIVLQDDRNVHVVGIVGMGGSGKTTLATHIFNIKRSKYDRSCFLSDDVGSQKPLTDLQSRLLEDLIGYGMKGSHFREGMGILESDRLSSCRALVVLDDMHNGDRLEALLAVKHGLRSGSLIVVTSRQKDLLRRSEISLLYDMKRLDPKHGQELFCLHAFGLPFPLKGFEDLVESFVNKCSGLPLSLKIFGGLVKGKNDDRDFWECQLKNLSGRLQSGIKEQLKISYDALEDDVKEMFLDAACFFIGEDKSMVIRIWDGCGWQGLIGMETLKDKCLVEVDARNRIKMHDQLRDLGRDINENSTTTPRLWRPDNMNDILERRSVIRGIRSAAAPCFTALDHALEAFGFSFSRPLIGLQLLVVEGYYFKGILSRASRDLVWLRWRQGPYKTLPSWLSMDKLRVLELIDGECESLREGPGQLPLQLRELNIHSSRGCFMEFPKSIGKLKHLEKIVLNCGGSIGVTMNSLPESFGDLTNLQHISLSHCKNLQMLPASFTCLHALKKLEMYGCKRLERLPESFGNLTNLQHLNLSYCSNLQVLPASFSRLRALKDLEMNNCATLRGLPLTFGNLTNLQHLSLSDCSQLQRLPDSFYLLIQLQYLSLGGCSSLGIPEGILRNISTLEYIDFSCCSEMKVLPSQISHQKSLKQIKLNAASLTELPKDIGNLSNLENLELESDVLTSLPHSIWNLSGLTKLKLNRCRMLDCLPRFLTAEDMPSSGEVYLPPRVEKMKNLEYLEISKCPLRDAVTPFTTVEGLFPELQRLLLRETKILRISITKEVCPHLKRLDLSWNSLLVKVVALPKTLESLLLCNCKALKRIWGNVHLPKLCELDVRGCCELQYLPNFAHLSALETLNADGCWKMKRMRGLEQLKRLKDLRISADDGDIWKDIRFLQMRSPSGSSTTSLTLRAVPGGEDGVEAILNSLPSHLQYVKPNSRGNEFSVQMCDIKFCTSAVMCFVLQTHPVAEVELAFHIESLISLFDDDSPRTNYGKWLNMSLFTEGSSFFRKLKDHGQYADELRIHIPADPDEITNGWMVTGRNGEEDEILEVWSKLMTHMERRCLSHYAGSVE